ncbi:MAG: hypothetical protein PHU43_05705 [Candidatus Bipolaricaulis sp.]|nr:hypothetical protein [Candidatus Bipolaricaulis sp.]
MRAKTSLILLFVVSAMTLATTGQDGARVFNVLLSDEDTGYLSTCTEVRIYSIDPTLGTRLSEVPVVILPYPASPIELTLDPGRYEIAIWLFYLSFEVKYMEFDVAENGVNVVNVMTVELPEGLVTY